MPNTQQTLTNLVPTFTPEEQTKLAKEVCADYTNDIQSRRSWEDKREKWYKLWSCVKETKSTPWPNASNVCLPILATAVNQFHARTYQSMFAAPKFVKTLPVGKLDSERSKMVDHYMNWQINYEMEEYEDVMDKLLLQLPINGIAFKKVQYDPFLERPVTSYIHPLDLILPYKTKSMAEARRITHRLWLHYEELLDRNEKNLYANFDKIQKEVSEVDDRGNLISNVDPKTVGETSFVPKDNPHLILECHKKILIDGVRTPVVLTVDYASSTLLRVANREVTANGKKKVLTYFIDYHFLPNPDGFYSFGLGHFLENLNDMANTTFNQIFDAGRLSNQPFGFYTRKAGLKRNSIKLHPGMMNEVQDASQVNFPQMQRLDNVLFQVLGIIQKYTEQFTSTTDYIMGREAQGTQNPTARGTLALIEQGLVTFSVITKRVYRSVGKELRLIFDLNQIFLPDSKEYVVTEDLGKLPFPDIKRKDFDTKFHIIPLADPTHASRSGRIEVITQLYQVLMTNILVMGDGKKQPPDLRAIHKITKMLMDAYGDREISAILPDLPPESIEPENENAAFMQGDAREPVQGEDHNRHLQVHSTFVDTPFFETMSKEYKKLLADHIQKTTRMFYEEEAKKSQLGGQQS